MIQRAIPCVAALCLVVGGAAAQVRKGGEPPAFAFEKVWNGAPTSFAGLEGHVVILDFSQTW